MLMSKTINPATLLREGSTIAKLYVELKDRKVHKYSVLRNKFNKAGVKRVMPMVFRLCRIIRANTNLMIAVSKRTDSIQLVPFVAAESKSTRKPTKKVSHSTKRKSSRKPAAVLAGESDDDALEE